MIVVGCSHGTHLGKRIATLAKKRYGTLKASLFPDGEQHLILPRATYTNKKVVLVQSFYPDPDRCLMEVIFAARMAKRMGASSVHLLAPFFPYMRQDKVFSKGEVDSIHILGWLLSGVIDEITILDPHLHREKTLGHIFSVPAHRVTANPLIGEYIKKHVDRALIVGPDWESYKWARRTAHLIKAQSTILLKERSSARRVKVRFQEDIDVKGRHIVIVDDMISTGNTLIKTIQALRSLGVRKVTCIAVHGLLVENALGRLRDAGATVVTTNSVPNNAARIDVAPVLAEKVR